MMKKTISTILATIICATSAVVADEGTKPASAEQIAQSPLVLGGDAIAQIRSAY